MATVKHLPGDSSVDDMIEAIEEDGVLIVDDFVSQQWLNDLNDGIQPFVDNYKPYDYGMDRANDFLGLQTVRLHGMITKAPGYLDLMLDERLLRIMGHFLAPNCGQYQLNSSEIIEIHGGETAQELHFDDMVWPVSYWIPDRLLQFNVMIAATDFTVENGATQVVPGSHRWSQPRFPEEHEITQAVMSAGSAVLIPGKTLHGGGTNTSGEKRRALVASYVLGWLRTQENHQLHYTVEDIAKLPERARQLLGYELYAQYDENFSGGPLGYYEYRNPSVLFEEN